MLGDVLLWIIIVLSSIFTLFWILVYVLIEPSYRDADKYKNAKMITVAIPAKDEEKTIYQTLNSIFNLEYPRDKLEVIVVDDGSTDNTVKEVQRFIKEKDAKNVILIKNKHNKGKAASLNKALKIASGDYFAVLDADTKVKKDALSYLVGMFELLKHKGVKIGAVISHIKVWNLVNFITLIQKYEYVYAQFMRELMSRIGLLYITPGAFTLYDTSTLRRLRGFDNRTITEDFEIALRLKLHGYEIIKDNRAITYTFVPQSFMSFFKQRLRWNLGFIENTKKYFWKFFKKKDFSLFGHIFYPLTLFSLFVLSSYVLIKSLDFIDSTYVRLKMLVYSKSFHLFETPLKDWLLGMDYTYTIPLIILVMMSALIYRWALKEGNDELRSIIAFGLFFIFYSLFTAFLWIYSYAYYLFSNKREWFK